MSGGHVIDPMGCSNKRHASQEIWRELANFRHPPLATALILPGSHRYELDEMLARGFRIETGLFLIEKNAAILATLTRRSKNLPYPPPSHRLCMPLSRAGPLLAQRGIRIDVAHLDFCANVEGQKSMIEETRAFLKSGVMAQESCLAVSWLAGREKNVERLEIGAQTFGVISYDHGCLAVDKFLSLTSTDRGRLKEMYQPIYEAIDATVTVRKLGQYQNTRTNNPMLWGVFHLKQNTPVPRPQVSTEAEPMVRSGNRRWVLPQEARLFYPPPPENFKETRLTPAERQKILQSKEPCGPVFHNTLPLGYVRCPRCKVEL